MKKIKNFLKRNIKYVIAFMLGTLVSIFGVYATSTLYDGNVVSYDSTTSGLKIGGVAVDNVQDAIDALYEKSLVCRENSIPTMAEMCPDCVYVTSRVGLTSGWYTTWNTAGQTPTVVNPSNWTSLGVEDNFDNVYQNTGSTYFLGIKLNENYQIEKAYACDVENNIPYCLESDANGDKYQYNVGILNAIFGEEKCSDSSSSYSCYGDISVAGAFNSGIVMAGGLSACAAKALENGKIWFGGRGC